MHCSQMISRRPGGPTLSLIYYFAWVVSIAADMHMSIIMYPYVVVVRCISRLLIQETDAA